MIKDFYYPASFLTQNTASNAR